MRTSLLASAIVACVLMAPFISAQEKAAGAPMTIDQQLPQMMTNMTKMQQQMDKIQATADPKEREKLLQDHTESMRDSMKILRGTAGSMNDGEKDKISTQDRLQMMERRMNMMQMMMDQMLQHSQAVEAPSTKYLRVALQ